MVESIPSDWLHLTEKLIFYVAQVVVEGDNLETPLRDGRQKQPKDKSEDVIKIRVVMFVMN